MSRTTHSPKKGRPKEPRPPEKGGIRNLIREWKLEEIEELLEEVNTDDDPDAQAD